MSILVLHPGDMGSAVGECLRHAGHDVFWVSAGRSAITSERARRAGLKEVGSLEEAVEQAEFVLSVCPPHGAVDLAVTVMAVGYTGTYIDANAVSPATSRRIQSIVEDGGASYVDGGIIGSPPRNPGTTRLYLCGDDTERVVGLFEGSNLDARLVDGPVGAASALKMVYAAWTKGTTAMLDAIMAVARTEGVDESLRTEWAMSQPSLGERLDRTAASASKAWRWVAEMEEIADTFDDAGMPDGFHRAAAEVFRRLAVFKDADDVAIDEVLAVLTDTE